MDRNKSLDHFVCSCYVLFNEWFGDLRMAVKHYLNVDYKDRDLAKRLGAKWDPSVRRWYCPSGSPLAKIFTWRKAANTVNGDVAIQSKSSIAVNENFDMFRATA